MATLPANANLEINLLQSLEAFLYTNVVTPYNAAVSALAYNDPLTIMIDDPDDPNKEAIVPALTLQLPTDVKDPLGLGMGDKEVWMYKLFDVRCYPAMSKDTNGTMKPSITAASMLRSLMGRVSTALTIPLYDYATSTTVPVDFAYIDSVRLINLRGAITDLALEKHRFDYHICIRFVQPALNG